MNLKNYYQRIKINNINYMAINETLKFSWGHIIAFVALIFISYVTFMGIAYLADGNFVYAGVGVVAIDVLMLLFFCLLLCYVSFLRDAAVHRRRPQKAQRQASKLRTVKPLTQHCHRRISCILL